MQQPELLEVPWIHLLDVTLRLCHHGFRDRLDLSLTAMPQAGRNNWHPAGHAVEVKVSLQGRQLKVRPMPSF